MAEPVFFRLTLQQTATTESVAKIREALFAAQGVASVQLQEGTRELVIEASPGAFVLASLLAARLEAAGILLEGQEPEERPLGFSAPVQPASKPAHTKSLPILGQTPQSAPSRQRARLATRWFSLSLPECSPKEALAYEEKARALSGVTAAIAEPLVSRLRVCTRLGSQSHTSLAQALGLTLPAPTTRHVLTAPDLRDPWKAADVAQQLGRVEGVVQASASAALGLVGVEGGKADEVAAQAKRLWGKTALRGEAKPTRSLRPAVGAMLGLFSLCVLLLADASPALLLTMGQLLAGLSLLCAARGLRDLPALLGAALALLAGVLGADASLSACAGALGVGLWARDYGMSLLSESLLAPLRALIAAVPSKARRQESNEEVAAEEILPGEVVVVRTGERVPIDGPVVQGRALLTAQEFVPTASLRPGEIAYAGQLLSSGEVQVRCVSPLQESWLARLILRTEELQAAQPRVSKWLAWSPYGVSLALLISGALLWAMIGREAVQSTILYAFLAVSLGSFRSPIGYLQAALVTRLAAQGLVLREPTCIDTAAKVDSILLDRSGALLRGEWNVTEVVPLRGFSEEYVLRYAAAAEQGIAHPIAEAIVEHARASAVASGEADLQEYLVGQGVIATVSGRAVYLGSALLMEENNISLASLKSEIAQWHEAGNELIFLALDRTLAGVLVLEDAPRKGAKKAVAALQEAQVTPILLTGADYGKATASVLGIGDIRAGVMPHRRPWEAESLRDDGHVVAAMGHAVHEAPLLDAATFSIALSTWSDDTTYDVETAVSDPSQAAALFALAKRHQRHKQTAQYEAWACLALPFLAMSFTPLWLLAFLSPSLEWLVCAAVLRAR